MAHQLGSRVRRLLVVLLFLGLTAAGLGTAGSAQADSSGHHWKVWAGNESKNMAIEGMKFLPAEVWIDEGDTVTWVANSAEIHTVTFFPGGTTQSSLPPFNPTDPKQVTRIGGRVYHPSQYFTSGLLTTDSAPLPGLPTYTRYTLKFNHDGTYTYYCLVHGVMMVGIIHVREEGTPYPFTQAQYNKQAANQAAAMLKDGRRLLSMTREKSDAHHVFAGAQDDDVMVMRFLRHTVHIPVGTRVSFINDSTVVPHTVTFGPEPSGAAALTPSGDPTHYTGGALNSGIMEPGQTFTVTFDKAGTYPYICILHDDMGMVGTVVVR